MFGLTNLRISVDPPTQYPFQAYKELYQHQLSVSSICPKNQENVDQRIMFWSSHSRLKLHCGFDSWLCNSTQVKLSASLPYILDNIDEF